eukprot:CAMPEP_0118950326 /NCGR_PEP_ID=MMETSP1169-20130426/51197_1 /TAXON_ID=36882 /ORGANISM="Pyramimonas obovata, Strain CCMP722" /LENGTH=67 /DNA_ID=CAMNT_0006897141 /DNA_START=223 /DNA_END=423 /DNA_ORIENTATION=-
MTLPSRLPSPTSKLTSNERAGGRRPSAASDLLVADVQLVGQVVGQVALVEVEVPAQQILLPVVLHDA